VSYEDDLAEMVTDEKFLYSNHTKTAPPKPELLRQVAGVGTSPIVNYPGTGAYFLDKLEDGVWRLEVMPDAIQVNDPHSATSLDKEVSVVQWREWPMELQLPDLGEGFGIQGLNQGNALNTTANGKRFAITPGAYLLTWQGVSFQLDRSAKVGNIRLNEFFAPAAHCKETYVVHDPPRETSVGAKPSLTATIVSPKRPQKVDLVIVREGQHTAIPMRETKAYQYTAEVPANFLRGAGLLRYLITVGNDKEFETFPMKFRGNHPLARRLRDGQTSILPGAPYQIKVMKESDPICLFEAEKDWEKVTRKDSNIQPAVSPATGRIVMAIGLSDRKRELAYQHYCGDRIEMRMDDVRKKNELVVLGYVLNDRPCMLGLTLIMKDATVYGGNVKIEPMEGRYALPLKDLKLQELRLIPPAIPAFQRRMFATQKPSRFGLDKVESLQILLGQGPPPESHTKWGHAVAIERILLQ